MKCELCGTEVRVVSEITKHHEPVMSRKLWHLIQACESVVHEVHNQMRIWPAEVDDMEDALKALKGKK